MGFEPTTTCLEGRSSTAELHPHTFHNPILFTLQTHPFGCIFQDGWRGIRTPELVKRPDLQSGAIDRSAIHPTAISNHKIEHQTSI